MTLTNKGYQSKDGALNGIESIQSGFLISKKATLVQTMLPVLYRRLFPLGTQV
ncbi:MAG: DUF1508 domain-containing protein [Chlorobi bacterium]|nr:DUF1508 domain-containing protein [Chlorobiota bacterium]